MRGVFDAFIKWGTATAQAADWVDPLSTAKQDLAERALANEGIESLDGKFKEVRDAAIECGLGEHFSLSYKVLSKFAHPTAMRILAPPNDKTEAVQREVFYSQGCLFFTGAFHALERELNRELGQRPSFCSYWLRRTYKNWHRGQRRTDEPVPGNSSPR